MTKVRIAGIAALALVMLAPHVMAQRRGGGAIGGGVRGAMVGGLVGGSAGAKTGARIGVVAGATRSAVNRAEDRRAMDAEVQTRVQYQASAEYQNAQRSDFNQTPPKVMVASPAAGSEAPGGEAVIRKDGKPAVGITYPSDWKQKSGEGYVTAVSKDGQAWSEIAILEGVTDKQAGIAKAKQELEKGLQDIKYDDLTELKDGTLVVTGTGKEKKAGVEVVFAAGVFASGEGRLAGVAFVVDKGVEDHYKETVRYICQTIRGEKGLAQ